MMVPFCEVRKRLLVVMLTAIVMAVAVPEVYTSSVAVAQTSRKNKSKKSSTNRTSKKSPAAKPSSGSRRSNNRKASGQKKNTRSVEPTSSEEAKRMQEAAQKDIQQTRERIRMNEEEIKTGLSDLNRLSADIKTGRAKVDGLKKKVDALNAEISSLNREIAGNEAELKLMREEYLKAVRKMRLNGKKQSMLAFIFSSDNFNQAMRRLRYVRQFSAWKAKKSDAIDRKISSLDEERSRLSTAKEAQTVALSQLSRSQADLESQHKEQEKIVAGLRQNGDALQKHLVAKQAEANRLKETISTLIAQELAKAEAERMAREKAEAERIAKEKAEAERIAREKAEAERIAAEKAAAEKAAQAKTSDQKTAEKEKADKKARKEKEKAEKNKKKNSENGARNRRDRRAKEEEKKKEDSAKPAQQPAVVPDAGKSGDVVSSSAAGKDFASLRGSLPRPVDGGWRITNPFGRHALPELPEIEYDNPGIDAEVATGAIVKAVCAGRVSGVYKVDGYRTVVIVNHGDYYTVYGNLTSANVSVGSQVGSGQSLGSAGSDPDDPRRGSVHFEIWKGREKQNPASWIR